MLLAVSEEAKTGLSRAQNIFMPANINSLVILDPVLGKSWIIKVSVKVTYQAIAVSFLFHVYQTSCMAMVALNVLSLLFVHGALPKKSTVSLKIYVVCKCLIPRIARGLETIPPDCRSIPSSLLWTQMVRKKHDKGKPRLHCLLLSLSLISIAPTSFFWLA